MKELSLMHIRDVCGLEMTVSRTETPALWHAMVEAFLSHSKATPTALATMLVADCTCVLAWCAKGFLLMMLARQELVAGAKAALFEAERLRKTQTCTVREQAYCKALRKAIRLDFLGAVAILEEILAGYPQDSFAAKLSHNMRFMLGDAAGMRQSIDALLLRAGVDHPHMGYLLGCRAFALEETGSYSEAEVIGRRALERAPHDAWGLHAVSHVHEMTGRAAEGAKFLSGCTHAIGHCNNFAFHVHWHHALFLLETNQQEQALVLYDSHIRHEETDDFRDIANATSLLMRLEMAGVGIGARWDALGALVARRLTDGSLVFAGLHYLMALLGAGLARESNDFAAHFGLPQPKPGAYHGNQQRIALTVGTRAAQGLQAYFAKDYELAANLLLGVRQNLHIIGGSHAQRDVFEQTMLESLVRSANPEHNAKARSLLLERLKQRSGNNVFALERLARLDGLARARAPSLPRVQ